MEGIHNGLLVVRLKVWMLRSVKGGRSSERLGVVKSGRGPVACRCSGLRANLWLGVSSLSGHIFWLCLKVCLDIVYSAARLPLTFVTCLAAWLSSVLCWSCT